MEVTSTAGDGRLSDFKEEEQVRGAYRLGRDRSRKKMCDGRALGTVTWAWEGQEGDRVIIWDKTT